MKKKLAIIGIDSLDPAVILDYRDKLPTFSKFITESPTFISQSVFPVDTIPAWATIFTGLQPSNHGLMYVYDIFDPNLSDLSKINFQILKGKTFWDYISNQNYKVNIIFPLMIYPPWEVNGTMLCTSPFERRNDWLQTEVDADCYPSKILNKYGIEKKFNKLWGGFPGYRQLDTWAELGKKNLSNEIAVSNTISTNEDWDLFFVYFSELDIIQHRLWRFFDEKDPLYKISPLGSKIFDYYKIIDDYLANFIQRFPDVDLIILSDHGHKIRPFMTFNINEFLRERKIIQEDCGFKNKMKIKIKNLLLNIINTLDLEEAAIKLIIKNPGMSKGSKSIYSSSFAFDKNKSRAYLSNFAGIKSYSFGGIEINKSLVPKIEYNSLCEEIVSSLSSLKTPDDKNLFHWIAKREDVFPGKFSGKIYPDIVFELHEEYGTGWDIYTNRFGKAYDHKIASGGHSKNGVFLIKSGENSRISRDSIHLTDITPSILDLFEIEMPQEKFDGRSIFDRS
jgi:predicted AlkP superfamily phosphohydrolase/phosphomutase